MITKEQAMTLTRFREVQSTPINPPLNTHSKKKKMASAKHGRLDH
jgi:hypothetical protein